MAAVDVVRARIDPGLKKEAADVLTSLGLTISDAIRMLLVRVAAERALPFEVRVPGTKELAAAEHAGVGPPSEPETSAVKKPAVRSLGDWLPELGSPVRTPGR